MPEVINHSKIGGSSCHRFWECAGSVALSEKAKELGQVKETSKFALEGTAAHLLAEICMKQEVFAYAEEYIGSLIEVEDEIFKVTKSMAKAVETYVHTVQSDLDLYRAKFKEVTFAVESKFNLDDVDKEAYGTNDAFLYVPAERLLVVYDYKHGKGVKVEVKENKQLMFYALGAISTEMKVDTIELVIVQPRFKHKDGYVRRWRCSIQDLLCFKQQLKEKIKATKAPDAPLRSGKWCKFCGAILICDKAEKQTWRQNTTYSIAQAMEDFS